MSRNQTEMTYLQAAVQDATPVGLVVILFDQLITDVERVIAALASGEVEKRATHLKHAFLILQQLEGSLDPENGGDATKALGQFYSAVRSKLLEGHIKAQPDIFRRQVQLLLDVRHAWQQVDKPNLASAAAASFSGTSAQMPRPAAADRDEERAAGSWSA